MSSTTQRLVAYDPVLHEEDQAMAFALFAAVSRLNELLRQAQHKDLRVELNTFNLLAMGERFNAPQVEVRVERVWALTGRHPAEQEPVPSD